MTIHKVSAGDGYDYLTRQVAVSDQDLAKGQDLASYYTASGEPPGIWAGQGCRDLGVSGIVRDDQMQSLWGEGYHPDADILGPIPLGRAFPTFSKGATPYSKSYMAALQLFREQNGRGATEPERASAAVDRGPGDAVGHGPAGVGAEPGGGRGVRREPAPDGTASGGRVRPDVLTGEVGVDVVGGRRPGGAGADRGAHRQAWQESLAYIEREAGFTRTGAGGVAQIETHGLVAAAFDHRTSRTGDPDLHTHVVLSSKVLGVDGKWRSLDGRPLYAIGVTASEMYNARLEDALVGTLGVAFHDVQRADPGKRPVREIAGVSPKLMKTFSRRRDAIEQRYRGAAPRVHRRARQGPVPVGAGQHVAVSAGHPGNPGRESTGHPAGAAGDAVAGHRGPGPRRHRPGTDAPHGARHRRRGDGSAMWGGHPDPPGGRGAGAGGGVRATGRRGSRRTSAPKRNGNSGRTPWRSVRTARPRSTRCSGWCWAPVGMSVQLTMDALEPLPAELVRSER